jgi:hypothetical protein
MLMRFLSAPEHVLLRTISREFTHAGTRIPREQKIFWRTDAFFSFHKGRTGAEMPQPQAEGLPRRL